MEISGTTTGNKAIAEMTSIKLPLETNTHALRITCKPINSDKIMALLLPRYGTLNHSNRTNQNWKPHEYYDQ